jgi:hypothetical protein
MRGPMGLSTVYQSSCAERELPSPIVRSRCHAGRSRVIVVELSLTVVAAAQRGGAVVDLHRCFVTPPPAMGRCRWV